jgi:hypothetical protein
VPHNKSYPVETPGDTTLLPNSDSHSLIPQTTPVEGHNVNYHGEVAFVCCVAMSVCEATLSENSYSLSGICILRLCWNLHPTKNSLAAFADTSLFAKECEGSG